jgi:energy-coupling factor transporter transmembrane protein EcfT
VVHLRVFQVRTYSAGVFLMTVLGFVLYGSMLLVPIFLLTLRRSQTMAWALEARGFQRSPRRSYLLEVRLARRDWLALAVGLLCATFFIILHLCQEDQIPGLKL